MPTVSHRHQFLISAVYIVFQFIQFMCRQCIMFHRNSLHGKYLYRMENVYRNVFRLSKVNMTWLHIFCMFRAKQSKATIEFADAGGYIRDFAGFNQPNRTIRLYHDKAIGITEFCWFNCFVCLAFWCLN